MQRGLTIILLTFAIFLIFLTTFFLKKGRIPEKYSLLWYGFSLFILLVGIFPNLFAFISEKLGVQVMSNLIIGIILAALIVFNMVLSIMIAGQKKKTTLLIQEISMLKQEVRGNEERK